MCNNKTIKRLVSAVLITAFGTVMPLIGCRDRLAADSNANSAAEPERRRMSLVVAGDLMQHMPQVDAARTADGFDYSGCFEHIAPLFRGADAAIVNLETTLTYGDRYSGYPMFSSPARLAFDMRQVGINYAVTANNHTLDKGLKGVQGTISALDSALIRHTGVFIDSVRYKHDNPLIIEAGGIRLALLNYTYGTNGMPVPKGVKINLIDTLEIKNDLNRTVELRPDLVMVYLHWGHEYHVRESKEQRETARWLHSQGVHLVIGSHPHVAQPLGITRDSLGRFEYATVYSLGNFVSNQSQPNTDGGLVVRFDISIEPSGEIILDGQYLPVWTYKRYEAGRRRYSIMPGFMADSLLSEDSGAAGRFEKFRKNLSGIISDGEGFAEMTAFVENTTE